MKKLAENESHTESIDNKVIAEILMFNSDVFEKLIERLVTLFIESTPKEMVELRRAIINSDPSLKDKAYSLKVVCAGLGAQKMVRILDHIEEGKASLNNALYLVETLETEYYLAYNELLPFLPWFALLKTST